MLPADVEHLIDDTNLAHLATVLPDGSPHSVPVWISRYGDRIAVLTGPGSRKARNLDADPRLAISIHDRSNPYRTALVRGRVTGRLDGEEGWRVIDSIARKYTGADYPLREDRIVLLIDADRADAIGFD